jgi:two-component system, sensor histidine kinase and response regulator
MNFAQKEPTGVDAPVDFPTALRWVEGDHELFAELIQIFLEDCPKKLHELEHAVKEGHAIAIRQTAHSLKGMVVCFATRSAHGIADEMERLGQAGDVSKTSDLLPTLLLEFGRVMHHLKRMDWRGTN